MRPDQGSVKRSQNSHHGVSAVNGYDARMRDLRRLMEADISVRRPSPKRDWKTRPSRKGAAGLGKTRKTPNLGAVA